MEEELVSPMTTPEPQPKEEWAKKLEKIWERDMITDDGIRAFSDPLQSIKMLIRQTRLEVVQEAREEILKKLPAYEEVIKFINQPKKP